MTRATTIAAGGLLLAVMTASCSSNPAAPATTTTTTTTPTTPTPSAATPETEVFIGTLAVKDSSFFSFNVLGSSNVLVTLASMTTGTPGPAVSIPVSLGLGVPSGIGCGLTQSVIVPPALTPQIAVTLDPGIFCVSIQDVGNLKVPVNFAIRIVHQ